MKKFLAIMIVTFVALSVFADYTPSVTAKLAPEEVNISSEEYNDKKKFDFEAAAELEREYANSDIIISTSFLEELTEEEFAQEIAIAETKYSAMIVTYVVVDGVEYEVVMEGDEIGDVSSSDGSEVSEEELSKVEKILKTDQDDAKVIAFLDEKATVVVPYKDRGILEPEKKADIEAAFVEIANNKDLGNLMPQLNAYSDNTEKFVSSDLFYISFAKELETYLNDHFDYVRMLLKMNVAEGSEIYIAFRTEIGGKSSWEVLDADKVSIKEDGKVCIDFDMSGPVTIIRTK